MGYTIDEIIFILKKIANDLEAYKKLPKNKKQEAGTKLYVKLTTLAGILEEFKHYFYS